jgi:hypothetical protein
MRENPLVGVWKLVSCDAIRKNGARIPIYGKRPVGRLIYDSAGHMSVHIMRSGRSRCASDTKFGASAEEMKVAYEGYEAYFSTYEVDPKDGTIDHKVALSLFPNWTGSIQRRYYALHGGNRLKLRTARIDTSAANGTIVELVWERIPDTTRLRA